MRLGDLIDLLEEIRDEVCDPDLYIDAYDIEVRLAHQPSWPFEYSISDVQSVYNDDYEGDDKPIVYIVEGEQLGYLPGDTKDSIGW